MRTDVASTYGGGELRIANVCQGFSDTSGHKRSLTPCIRTSPPLSTRQHLSRNILSSLHRRTLHYIDFDCFLKMRTNYFLTALVAFAPFSNAGALSSDFLLGRSLDLINDLTSDEAIFRAFGEAGHADTAPVQTWTNGMGDVYQSLYSFDEQEWQDMRASILSKNGLNETDVLEARGLVARQDEDPPAFFCKNINTNPRVRRWHILEQIDPIS